VRGCTVHPPGDILKGTQGNGDTDEDVDKIDKWEGNRMYPVGW